MKDWKLVAVISLMLAFMPGCGGPPVLPDRTDPEVKAEETRIAKLLSTNQDLLGVPGGCTVRLLGQQGTASFVWAKCDARDSSYSASVPLRVIGPKITKPVDGAGFSDSVRKMFPKDLAEYVLANRDSPKLRP